MPPKRKVKSAFWFFMADFRDREQAKGRRFHSIEQVKREAAPHWEALDDETKGKYVTRAKDYKREGGAKAEKYTAQGVPMSVVDAAARALKQKEEAIKVAVAEMIQTAMSDGTLEKMQVNLISFNHFCKSSGGDYVPAELAMVRYSLEVGVQDKLHEFINPGRIPLGMAYDAMQLTTGSHQLPLPPEAMGDIDYEILLGKIITFKEQVREEQRIRNVLFAGATEVAEVENVLDQFARESKIAFDFLVCPLPDFFYQLKVATEGYGMEIKSFPNKCIAGILLRKDPYEYAPGIACSFHEKLGNTRHCPLSRVTRWTYIISDNCCLDIGIDLIPGRHLPANADTTLFTDASNYNRSDDRMSFVSSSDLTHLSMPKMQNHRPRSRSPIRNISGNAAIEDAHGAVIYSSRPAATRDTSATASSSSAAKLDKKVMSNPFYMMDSAAAGSSKRADRDDKKDELKGLGEFREPLPTVGHGRGMLLKRVFGSMVGSTVSMGTGRGSLLFGGAESSVGAASTILRTSDDEDDD